MLITENENGNTIRDWHVGQPLSGGERLGDVHFVHYVFASDDELEHVRRIFPALTPAGKRTARWHGDIARTIYLNL